jgi:hypothetical protein
MEARPKKDDGYEPTRIFVMEHECDYAYMTTVARLSV